MARARGDKEFVLPVKGVNVEANIARGTKKKPSFFSTVGWIVLIYEIR